MNYNILTYIVFLSIIIYIILVVGKICYRNGNIYVLNLLQGHEELCTTINKILLAGYYLVNIGYAVTTLAQWQEVTSFTGMIENIAAKTAFIIGVLSLLHYINIIVITKYVQKLINT